MRTYDPNRSFVIAHFIPFHLAVNTLAMLAIWAIPVVRVGGVHDEDKLRLACST